MCVCAYVSLDARHFSSAMSVMGGTRTIVMGGIPNENENENDRNGVSWNV